MINEREVRERRIGTQERDEMKSSNDVEGKNFEIMGGRKLMERNEVKRKKNQMI